MSAEAAVNGSLADQAYRRLEHRLVTLRYRPGEFLQEQSLADSLAIGRTPVREAVQRLGAAEMLSVLPRKGLLVAPLDKDSLHSVIETRRVLERLLVARAAERADPGQRAKLEVLARQLESAAGNAQRFYRVDRQLDHRLAVACASPFLARALEPLHLHCRRLWYRFRRTADLGTMAEFHAHAARAVAEGDSTGAIRAVNGIIGVVEGLLDKLDDAT